MDCSIDVEIGTISHTLLTTVFGDELVLSFHTQKLTTFKIARLMSLLAQKNG
jgi:hypothetical protein